MAFPGLFPDLTRYQAEADQARIDKGQDTWKNDPAKVAQALTAKFFDWKRPSTTQILSGGGARDVDAVVLVKETAPQGAQSSYAPFVRVTLSRLGGNTHNIWVVVKVEDDHLLTLTNIPARSLVFNPVTLKGKGAAFEAVIGRAVVYDHLYNDIGHAQITGSPGMGIADYSTSVQYRSTYGAGAQEGIIAVHEANGGLSEEIYTAVMVKVLLAQQR
ncbi:MAG: hypothetical protein IMW89_14055 [Ktedonobacteraceae bacterium]|nr:hypothetical protein [Ktedonobacteraceae bacterium]